MIVITKLFFCLFSLTCYFSTETGPMTDEYEEAIKAGGIPCVTHLKNLTEITHGYLEDKWVYTIYCGRDDTDE